MARSTARLDSRLERFLVAIGLSENMK